MTVKEKLTQEFVAAISAVFGDQENNEFSADQVCESDLVAIAQKVKFYMDL